MHRYVLKRVLMVIPIVLGVTLLVYFIMDLTPGNPAMMILGDAATQEDIDRVNEEYGFNKPFIERYVSYMTDALQGNFGKSYVNGRPVMVEVLAKFPLTLSLAFFGVFFASLIGVPLGIQSAVKQYSLFDSVSVVTAMLLSAVPAFWLGMIFILLFALRLRWLPPSGIETWRHYILPVATVTFPQAASILRFSRSTMLETIRQDYIRTARAKGAKESVVIYKHALKNALLPIITVIGVQFGGLLGGIVIVESVFSLPGMGQLAITAIRMKDVPQIMAAIIFLSFVFCLIMLVVDLLYAFVDPRIRSIYSVKRERSSHANKKTF